MNLDLLVVRKLRRGTSVHLIKNSTFAVDHIWIALLLVGWFVSLTMVLLPVHNLFGYLEKWVLFFLDFSSARHGHVELVVLGDITFTDVLFAALATLESLLQFSRVNISSPDYSPEDDDQLVQMP